MPTQIPVQDGNEMERAEILQQLAESQAREEEVLRENARDFQANLSLQRKAYYITMAKDISLTAVALPIAGFIIGLGIANIF